MKKKLLTTILVAGLVLGAMTGCGSDETTNDASQEIGQEATATPTEAPTPKPTEAPTPKPTEAPTPEPTEAPTPAPETTVSEGDIDWSTAYEGYFEREGIMGENVSMSMDVSQDGLTFAFEMATVNEITYMNFDFGVVALEMYADEEKMYLYTEMEGETNWNYALLTSEEDVDGMLEIGESTTVDADSFSECVYYEEVIEDGVVYDVLYATSTEDGEVTNAYCYVNRETQKLYKMSVVTEMGPMDMFIQEIDTLEIPAEALSGTEITMEDAGALLMGVIMAGVFSAMEQ